MVPLLVWLGVVLFESLGQAEVGDLGDAVRGHEDVGRLQVAVEDAVLVGEVHRPRQAGAEQRGLARRQGLAAQLAVERSAVDEFEREERQPILFADVVDLDDVRMLEGGDRLGLDVEAGQLMGAGMGARQDHLEGHEPVEPALACLVHDAHAAPAELAEDPVAGDGRPISGGAGFVIFREPGASLSRAGPGSGCGGEIDRGSGRLDGRDRGLFLFQGCRQGCRGIVHGGTKIPGREFLRLGQGIDPRRRRIGVRGTVP